MVSRLENVIKQIPGPVEIDRNANAITAKLVQDAKALGELALAKAQLAGLDKSVAKAMENGAAPTANRSGGMSLA